MIQKTIALPRQAQDKHKETPPHFYTGGESHRTHVTSYGVYGSVPSSWTPAVNSTIPTRGCAALWDMHNDSASVVAAESEEFSLAREGSAAEWSPHSAQQTQGDLGHTDSKQMQEQQGQAVAPPVCGARVLHDTGCATQSYSTKKAASWEACCSACAAEGLRTCRNWVYAKGTCHLRHNCSTGTHASAGVTCGLFPQAPPAPPPPPPPPPAPLPPGFGGFAAKVNGTYSNELYAVSDAIYIYIRRL